MRLLIQRVRGASVVIGNEVYGDIGPGALVFIGIEEPDTADDVEWLVQKLVKLRIFADGDGVMNLCALDVGADFLVVSQFTLHASTRKGNRPSYIRAARPETAVPLYELFLTTLRRAVEEQGDGKPGKIATGVFGAYMQVALINDGPVTIWIDSKDRE